MTTQLFDEIEVIIKYGKPWYKAKDIVDALDLPKGSVCDHVESDCIMRDAERVLWVNEPGAYSLTLLNKTDRSKRFRDYVYSTKKRTNFKHHQFEMITEYDLHVKVVDFIRKHYPEAILIAACGENQDTSSKRISSWKKGYQRGTPDLIIANAHEKYSGLVIEFKNPGGTGRCSEDQEKMMLKLEMAGYQTLLCDSYDDAINAVTKYFSNIRFRCSWCTRGFKSKVKLDGHNCRAKKV